MLAKMTLAIATITIALMATSGANAEQSNTFNASITSASMATTTAAVDPEVTSRFDRIKAVSDQFQSHMREQVSADSSSKEYRGHKMFKSALAKMDNS